MPSALGIETVECFSEGGRTLTVRVSGRWRRRRPEWRGQPMLVVEADGTRHRFLAMPDPPSLSGAVPGTWRMTFSVPAELGPRLEGRAWLQLGAVVVPLPVAAAIEAAVPGPPSDPETLAARQLRGFELAVENARKRVAEAEAAAAELTGRIRQLEDELEEARGEPRRLTALLAERERRLRDAEQRVHAERALRLEVEEELAGQAAVQRALREALGEVATREARIRELEEELQRARRAGDEAEHLAAAAAVGKQRGRRRAGPAMPDRVGERLRGELALASGLLGAPVAAAAVARPAQPRLAELLRFERELIARRGATPRTQPEARASSEPTLAQLREQLERLRAVAERERAEREEAEQRAARLERALAEQSARSGRVYEAIEELRGELAELRAAHAGEPLAAGAGGLEEPPRLGDPAGPVEAQRLSAALARLREASPSEPQGAAAEERPTRSGRPTKPWLRRAFRRLVVQDPAAAGRLLVALLPAQHVADRRPVAYDLVLGESTDICVQVSAGAGPPRIDFGEASRSLSEVDFQVTGDLASIARLVAAGRVRRRFGRGLARVRGERARFSALERLVSTPLTLRELHAAGVRLDPALALTIVSLVIDPAWTAGERFTIAHEVRGARLAGAFLHVRDGGAPLVTDRPAAGPVETTIVSPADMLLPTLAGDRSADVFVRGEQRPLTLLAHWLERAQSG